MKNIFFTVMLFFTAFALQHDLDNKNYGSASFQGLCGIYWAVGLAIMTNKGKE